MGALKSESVPTLAELETWARDPSRDNWSHLLKVLTDIFTSDIEAHAARHGDAYADVVCKLLDEVAAEVRVELSERVAPMGKFPKQVVTRLANDEDATVASPVLEHSPVLTEAELIGIIDMMLPARSLAISKRKQLGERVTDMLVKRGDDDTIRTMTANPGAEFSDHTYRLVAEKAKNDPGLQESLVSRDDMTQAIAIQITPFLSAALKERLRTLDMSSEGGSLLDSLSDVTGAAAQKKTGRQERAEAYAAAEQVRAGDAKASDVAQKMAEAGEMHTLVPFLAGIALLSEKSVSASMTNPNGTPLAVTCKGLGLTKEAFSAIAKLRAKDLGMSSGEALRYIDGYAKLNSAEAEKTLHMLQDKEKKSGGGKGGGK